MSHQAKFNFISIVEFSSTSAAVLSYIFTLVTPDIYPAGRGKVEGGSIGLFTKGIVVSFT